MFKIFGRVLGGLFTVGLLATPPLAAYADNSGLPPFTATDLAKQRTLFKALLSGIGDDMTRPNFESIIGRKLTTDSLGNDAGGGGHSDVYRTANSYDGYAYGFSYAEIRRGASLTLYIIGFFYRPGALNTDDKTCLSLADIKDDAEAGGWKVDKPFAKWTTHGINAVKGRLHLTASAAGGIGEPGMPGDAYAVWINKYGRKGCIVDLRIEQTS